MNDIFGYSWEAIQRAQQKGKLETRAVPRNIVKPQATEEDKKLLAELGETGLREKEMFGVLDRLNLL